MVFVNSPEVLALPGPIADTDAYAATLYHVAPAADREAVLAHGLDSSRSDREFAAAFADYPPGNYLHAAIDLAVAWLDGMQEEGEDFDLWQVDATGLELRHDPHDMSDTGDYYFYSASPIPADRLTLTDPASHAEWR